MSTTTWTETDSVRALQIWDEYLKHHDVSNRIGEAAGIDPVSGRVWFGESGVDIVRKMQEDGIHRPLYFVRVGSDYYVRKGGHK
jgi:hypothetical protein